MSILEEFAYGNVSPNARRFERDSKYSQAIELVKINEQKLLEGMDERDKIEFKKYIGAQEEFNRLTAVSNLMYGFKLGLIVTAESFIGSNSLINGMDDTL